MDIGENIKKVLDRGETVVMFLNDLGSYTAAVVSKKTDEAIQEDVDAMDADALTITDDFTPGKTLHRLGEKMLRAGEYVNWPD